MHRLGRAAAAICRTSNERLLLGGTLELLVLRPRFSSAARMNASASGEHLGTESCCATIVSGTTEPSAVAAKVNLGRCRLSLRSCRLYMRIASNSALNSATVKVFCKSLRSRFASLRCLPPAVPHWSSCGRVRISLFVSHGVSSQNDVIRSPGAADSLCAADGKGRD